MDPQWVFQSDWYRDVLSQLSAEQPFT